MLRWQPAWVTCVLVGACGRIGFDPSQACAGCDAQVDCTPRLQPDWTRADTGSATVTALEIPRPAGLQQGDLVVVVFTVDDSGLSPTGPAGFIDVTSAEGGARHVAVYRRLATDVEPDVYQVSWVGGDQAIGYALRVTGADATTPIGNRTSTVANSEPATFETFATSADDVLILAAVTTPLNVPVCGAAEWSPPFTKIDCFVNAPSNNATVAVEGFRGAATLVEPIYNFFDPPDNHASALVEILPAAGCLP